VGDGLLAGTGRDGDRGIDALAKAFGSNARGSGVAQERSSPSRLKESDVSGEQSDPDELSRVSEAGAAHDVRVGGVTDQTIQLPGQGDREVVAAGERRVDSASSSGLAVGGRASGEAHGWTHVPTLSAVQARYRRGKSCVAQTIWVKLFQLQTMSCALSGSSRKLGSSRSSGDTTPNS